MIEINRLSHQYQVNGNQANPLRVLEQIDLLVNQGEFVSIIGPSGCGKSTLLRLVAGLVEPTAGGVQINGRNPVEARRRREVGFVFQTPELLPWRSVEKNIRLPLEIFGDQSEMHRQVQEHIRIVGLTGFERYSPAQLSGGMKSRVALARALVYNPSILLMDESFGNLDELTRERMNLELLRIWHEWNRTVLFVTHNVAEAVFLSDRVVVLTSRPATIAKIVEIHLPRPRRTELKEMPEFFEHARLVRSELERVSSAA